MVRSVRYTPDLSKFRLALPQNWILKSSSDLQDTNAI
jgi:hypothetical protein